MANASLIGGSNKYFCPHVNNPILHFVTRNCSALPFRGITEMKAQAMAGWQPLTVPVYPQCSGRALTIGHSVAEFKVKHTIISNVKGDFAKINGALTLDESELTNSRVEALVEATPDRSATPIVTRNLKSADSLDVEKSSTLSFKSTRVNVCGTRGREACRRRRPDHSRHHAQSAFCRTVVLHSQNASSGNSAEDGVLPDVGTVP
jgi:hypothetical protein